LTGVLAGLSVLTGALVWWYARRGALSVREALSPDAVRLAAQLSRTAPGDRLSQARRLARTGTWEHTLVQAASVPDPIERREALSTCVDEASAKLTISVVASALPRIQGLLAAFFTVASVALSTLVEAAVAAAVGLGSAVVVSVTVQAASAKERQQRRTVDQLVHLLDVE
jgi:hypothetical protein